MQLALVLDFTAVRTGCGLPPFLDPQFFAWVMLGVVGATFLALWLLLEERPFGLKLKASRGRVGWPGDWAQPAKLKLQAYVLSPCRSGLSALSMPIGSPSSTRSPRWVILITDQAVVMAIFGGLGTLIGPVIGAILFFAFKTYFWAYLSDYQVLYLIILGLAIAATVFFLPDGFWGTVARRQEGRRACRKGIALAQLPEK